MAENKNENVVQCYLLPSAPMPIVLPVECIAEIVAKPKIEKLDSASANWMKGHTRWRNQRIPVLSFAALNDPELDESRKRKPHLVVLNPVPSAARKAYTGLLCYGNINQIDITPSAAITDIPESVDKRYVEAALKFEKKTMMVPKLPAVSVAFSYF